MTNEKILDIAERWLEYSDFGNWFGDEDHLIEFAEEVMQEFKKEICE